MRKLAFVLALLSGLTLSLSANALMYRFKIDGRTVVYDHVPQKYSQLGYEVVSNRGMVIKTVEPAPTKEELAERERQKKLQAEREQRQQELTKSDKKLLLLYPNKERVEHIKKRRIDDVYYKIGAEKLSISNNRKVLDKIQSKITRLEKQDKAVPAEDWVEVVKMQKSIRDSEERIQNHDKEIANINKEFAQIAKRVRILQLYPAGTLEEDVDFERIERELGPQ